MYRYALLLMLTCILGCSRSSNDLASQPADDSSQAAADHSAPAKANEGANEEDADAVEATEPTDSGDQSASDHVPVDDDSDQSKENSPQTEDAAGQASPASDESQADSQANSDVAESETTPNVVAEPTIERLLLLPPSGPIVVELQLRDGTQSLVDSWHDSAVRVIELSDADDDGATSWDELMANQSLIQTAFGNLNLEGDQTKTLIRSYDANRDDKVDPDEFIQILGRNQRNVGELILDSQAFDPFKRVAESGIRKWLDVNGDGLLSTEDKKKAPVRLLLRDGDEDHQLWAVDFAPSQNQRNQPNSGMMMRYRQRGPQPVRILHGDLDWGELQVDIEETYAFGSPPTEEDFGSSALLFRQLDSDGSGDLRARELMGLLDAEPHLTIAVDRGTNQIADGGLTELEPAKEQEDTEESKEVERNVAFNIYQPPPTERLSIEHDGLLLDVTSIANRKSSYGDNEQFFATIDRDKNMYIDQSELQISGLAQISPFDQVDRDNDGKVDAAEMTRLVDFITAYEQSGLVVSVEPSVDPIFAVLDGNRSGRLEAREIRDSGNRLMELDANKDGRLSSSELPTTLTVTIRGRQPYNRGNAFAARNRSAPPAAPEVDAPEWFKQMDRNRDGEIDSFEFLGTIAKFQQLDKDGDGFFEADEVDGVE